MIKEERMMVCLDFWVDMPVSIPDEKIEELHSMIIDLIEHEDPEYVVKEKYSTWEVDAN